MNTSGSNWIKPAKEPLIGRSQDTPAGNKKDRLEDILNDLMKLDGLPPLTDRAQDATEKEQHSVPIRPATLSNLDIPATKQKYWKAIQSELNLPNTSEGAFRQLKSFQQSNRHKPVHKLLSGQVIYVEYDVEMERIKVFVGKNDQFTCVPNGMRELSGMLIVEEVYEFRAETKTRDMLGFKRVENKIHERFRVAKDLLHPGDMGKSPVLHFSMFAQKGMGISTCLVKAKYID